VHGRRRIIIIGQTSCATKGLTGIKHSQGVELPLCAKIYLRVATTCATRKLQTVQLHVVPSMMVRAGLPHNSFLYTQSLASSLRLGRMRSG
jgi:hypothetical protein